MVAEVLMDHLARAHGEDAAQMRELNMYKEGDTTHFKQILDGCQASTQQQHLPCLPFKSTFWPVPSASRRVPLESLK